MTKPNWKSTGFPGDWVILKDKVTGEKVLWVWTGEDWVSNDVVWNIQIDG